LGISFFVFLKLIIITARVYMLRLAEVNFLFYSKWLWRKSDESVKVKIRIKIGGVVPGDAKCKFQSSDIKSCD